MTPAKSTLTFYAIFAVFGIVAGQMYFPDSCANTCGPDDFIQELSNVSISDGGNRAYFWAAVTLLQVEENLAQLSPPGIARITGIVGSCLYEAAVLHHEEMKSNLDMHYSLVTSGSRDMLQDALDGAGFWAVQTIFGQRESFSDVFRLYFQGRDLDLDKLVAMMAPEYWTPTKMLGHFVEPSDEVCLNAAALGANACQMVIEQYTADGFEPDGTLGGRPDPTGYMPVNRPQRLAGITDCDNEITVPGAWQPLCAPSSADDVGTTNCTAQTALAPFAGRFTTFALPEGDETTGEELVSPPPSPGSEKFEEEWREVLEFSANLDDVHKIVAEYWADGPDSTAPPGHWFKIAADAAITEGLNETDTARLLFVVGNALNDAGVASWRVKFTYDSSRPLQMIQCGDFRGEMKMAWRGPYMGVSPTNVSEWHPYQAADAATPPFPGYVSGHSTFSAAAAKALSLFFGDDTYKGPPCFKTKGGESLFEPQSDDMAGFSDIPNSGFDTVGYVPREDVVLCWDTYTEAAEQAGVSRLLGGIHVRSDDLVGYDLGHAVGQDAFDKAQALMH